MALLIAIGNFEGSKLTCLHQLLFVAGHALTPGMIKDMMKEMPPLINENDLHVSQVGYFVCTPGGRSTKRS